MVSADQSDRNLIEWAETVVRCHGHKPAKHHRLLMEELEALSRGDAARLMVQMPPGSAKSTYAYVNTNLWGAYLNTPSVAGTWYIWVEGINGSEPTAYPTGLSVT
jgi:hypothetical protein